MAAMSVTSPATSIESEVFADNSGLTQITLPDNENSGFSKYKDSNGNEYNAGENITNFSLSYYAVLPQHELTIDDVEFAASTGEIKDYTAGYVDIFIPSSFSVDGNDIDIKAIRLEDLLLLKAREASEESDEVISRIAELLADPEVKLSIDKNYLRNALNYFPEDERNSIIRRLEKCGIYLE